jgi:hypothetical protein
MWTVGIGLAEEVECFDAQGGDLGVHLVTAAHAPKLRPHLGAGRALIADDLDARSACQQSSDLRGGQR